jgi:hypothetical protein
VNVEEQNRSALKEWAAVEHILARGDSCVLLRKGGIWERRADFEVEHREFWIFPTFFHQNPNELVSGNEWALERAKRDGHDPDFVRIRHYAVVEDAYRVEEMGALERLAGLHPMRDETVRSRFHYRGKPVLHVLALRMYRLPEPRAIRNTLDYEGCISWVELDEPIATATLEPVLTDAAFAEVRGEVAERLGEAAIPV